MLHSMQQERGKVRTQKLFSNLVHAATVVLIPQRIPCGIPVFVGCEFGVYRTVKQDVIHPPLRQKAFVRCLIQKVHGVGFLCIVHAVIIHVTSGTAQDSAPRKRKYRCCMAVAGQKQRIACSIFTDVLGKGDLIGAPMLVIAEHFAGDG